MRYQEYVSTEMRGISITRNSERMFVMTLSMAYQDGPQNLNTDAVAAVYEHALLAGCGSFSREQFLSAVNLLGASITVSAEKGILTIAISCLDVHQTKLKVLVAQMLHAPSFEPSEIKRIVQQVTNELIESQEDAKTRSIQVLVNTLYSKRDYRYNFGAKELTTAIATIKKSDLVSFHKRAMQHTWTYTFASDTNDEKKTLSFLQKTQEPFVERQKKGQVQTKSPVNETKKIEKKIVVLTSVPSKQNIEINIGASLPLTQDDSYYYAFVFGLSVLGKWGGFAGRLMSTVREKEGLTYGIYAKTDTTTYDSTGYWHIMTFFAPEKVKQGIASTLREVDLIKTKGITQVEFDRFKVILKTEETMLQDSLLQNVKRVHTLQLKGFTYEQMAERNKRMLAVTRAEVNAALKKYLDTSKLVISAAGPVKQKEKELMSLAK
jgi:zinc protease